MPLHSPPPRKLYAKSVWATSKHVCVVTPRCGLHRASCVRELRGRKTTRGCAKEPETKAVALIRFHGGLAPNARLHAEVVPTGPPEVLAVAADVKLDRRLQACAQGQGA